jgi:DNA-binding NtrC family response regulator
VLDDKFEVLIVDDDPSIRKRCVQLLHKKGYRVEGISSGEVALSIAQSRFIGLVVTDIRMPGLNGLALLEQIKETNPHTEVIMITGYGTVESAVTAIKLGAYDYLTKPFDMDKLLKVVENVSEKFSLGEEIRSLKERLQAYAEASEIVSISERMQRILELIHKVAPIDCNVLIQGESGTGKGLVAQQIHRRSPRQAHPLVVVDCAALSETLLESELFGYVKGAFTGAYADKEGYFKVAHRGTIFLDEVGELSPALQGKLLRMVQDHEIIPVGSTRPITIDARIIAATNKDLEALVREGRFREDLFFRLNVVRIAVPPLRDRPEDISLLAHFFLEKFKTRFRKFNCTLDPKVLSWIQSYGWPGNVRELENLMQNLVVVSDDAVIRPPSLPEKIRRVAPGNGDPDPAFLGRDFSSARKMYLDHFTRNYLVNALRSNHGNISATAKQVNLRRSSLQRMIKRYAITNADWI